MIRCNTETKKKPIIHTTYETIDFHIGICISFPYKCSSGKVTGSVLEEGSKEPLTGASVILRNAEGRIKKVRGGIKLYNGNLGFYNSLIFPGTG